MKTKVMKEKQGNFGFSLVEVMVAVGLVGVIMMALMSMTDIMNANNRRLNMVQVRNDIVNNIRTQSLVYTNIDSSALMTNTYGVNGITPDIGTPNNLAHFDILAKCLPSITNPLLTGCNKTVLDDPTRGNLFYLANHNSVDINQAIAGEDVYYRLSGLRCNSADSAMPERCPLFARTWAEPFCLDFRTNCNKAMSITIRYSVGLRPDYPPGFVLPQADGEIYLPLQKGIQITRVMDQNNGTLSSNVAGIFPVQKYLGFPDQAGRPQGLRFEVVVGNPTGLKTMKVMYRALTGSLAADFDENSIPSGLEALTWIDVINPALGVGSWSISDLDKAVPSQFFHFGLMTTPSSTVGIVPSNFAIGSANLNNPTYHWTINPSDPTHFVPPTFKSGFYQFKIVATDVSGGTIESTNYATVRVIPRPEIKQTNPGSNPTNIQRNCTTNNTLATTFLIGDDEGITSTSATILKISPAPASSISPSVPAVYGTNGEINIPFDLQQATGQYQIIPSATDFYTSKIINGITIPRTQSTLVVNLLEVAPIVSPITSIPAKIRISMTGVLSEYYSTGSCCTQTPLLNWTFPSVPAAPGIMLSGDPSSPVTCTTDVPSNTRICTGTNTVVGIKEGPNTATSDVLTNFVFPVTIEPACKMSSGMYSQSAYIQVVNIPGIAFYTPESLWLDFSDLRNESGLMTLAPTRQAWIKADFAPDAVVSVKVVKATDLDTTICTATFSPPAGTTPVLKPCPLPDGYSGDYILLKNSSNVQGEADTPNPLFRAKLISGQTTHRTCLAQFSSLAGKSSSMTLSSNFTLWNSPFNASESPAGSGNTALGQDPKNDAEHWNSGDSKFLRCYDRWNEPGIATYTDIYNNQDRKVIKLYRDGVTPADPKHLNFTIPFHQYVFPNTISPDFSYADNVLPPGPPNTPTFFMVTSGTSTSLTWQFVGAGTSTTPPQVWVDRTSELCSGGASLSQIKLLATKMVGYNSPTTNMKAANRIITSTSEAYSYAFFCTYGRWTPQGPGSTSWIH